MVRVIVTDMDINLAMLMDELNYSGNEGDEDIYYTMSFSEYVTLNVPTVNITPKVRDNGCLLYTSKEQSRLQVKRRRNPSAR